MPEKEVKKIVDFMPEQVKVIAKHESPASALTETGNADPKRPSAGSHVNVYGQTTYRIKVAFCFVYLALFVFNELHPSWAESFFPPWNGLLGLGSLLFVVAARLC